MAERTNALVLKTRGGRTPEGSKPSAPLIGPLARSRDCLISILLKIVKTARGHAKDPAHVLAEGAQGVGSLREALAHRPYTIRPYNGLFFTGRGAGPCRILTSSARTIRRSL